MSYLIPKCACVLSLHTCFAFAMRFAHIIHTAPVPCGWKKICRQPHAGTQIYRQPHPPASHNIPSNGCASRHQCAPLRRWLRRIQNRKPHVLESVRWRVWMHPGALLLQTLRPCVTFFCNTSPNIYVMHVGAVPLQISGLFERFLAHVA